MSFIIPQAFASASEFFFFEFIEILGVVWIQSIVFFFMNRIAVIKEMASAAVMFVFVKIVFPVKIFFIHVTPSLFCEFFFTVIYNKPEIVGMQSAKKEKFYFLAAKK